MKNNINYKIQKKERKPIHSRGVVFFLLTLDLECSPQRKKIYFRNGANPL